MGRFRVGFAVVKGGDGHFWVDCTFLPILHVWELPEFVPLMARDRSKWSPCLLWHGWLPGLSLAGERDPWAASLSQLAYRSLEQVLGAHRVDNAGFWTPPDF